MGREEGNRPVIGVSGPDEGGGFAWLFVRFALKRAGASPRRITPSRPADPDELDGLVISGGADINPHYYGKTRQQLIYEQERTSRKWWVWLGFPVKNIYKKAMGIGSSSIDDDRDELELDLLNQAVETGLPVLGICRGMQLINIFFGGSLLHDLRTLNLRRPNQHTLFPRKVVLFKRETMIKDILRCRSCRVNSLHNQAIDQVGKGLVISARDRNLLAQCVENPTYPFLIGVQWHPEYLPQLKRQQRIFRRLVDAAIKFRQHVQPAMKKSSAAG